MSNKQVKNGKEMKKMSSIAKRLHGQLVWSKMGLFFAANLFLFLTLSLTWLYQLEKTGLSKNALHGEVVDMFSFDLKRSFTMKGGNIFNLTYVVTDGNRALIEENIFEPFTIIMGIILVSMIFQFLNITFSYYHEYVKIKKILNPINEIAIKADEMSRISFDEAKYHTIENAIEHISPEQTTELSLGDNDLAGIEAAMNNMLDRMHDTYLQQARFVNDASHELRTPIAVIQGYANMLDRWGKEDEEILDESINAIKNESDHMNHLVEQLLFLARGDAGRNTMNIERVSLNDVMKEIYEESLMIDEEHVYKFKEVNQNVVIQADASMIKQAMRILVDNAAKYTNRGDEIVLSVGFKSAPMNGELGDSMTGLPYIQVQDNGIGMAEVDVKHMFERFYRADDTRKVQGTGLGLSIAKWIVDKHRGHFEILSRKDIGTRIRIVFE